MINLPTLQTPFQRGLREVRMLIVFECFYQHYLRICRREGYEPWDRQEFFTHEIAGTRAPLGLMRKLLLRGVIEPHEFSSLK